MTPKEELQVEISRLKRELADIGEQQSDLARQTSKARKRLNAAELEMEALDKPPAKTLPRVSDHAVIRYLERVYGFDFEKHRKELLTEGVVAAMSAGAKRIKYKDFALVLEGNTVVTVVN